MTRLEQLQQLLEASPADSFLLFAIAKEHEKLQSDTQALSYYLRLKEQDPNYVGLYYHLGKLYERQGKFQQAWAIYSEGMAVAKAAGDQHAQSELAGARLELGDEEDFA